MIHISNRVIQLGVESRIKTAKNQFVGLMGIADLA